MGEKGIVAIGRSAAHSEALVAGCKAAPASELDFVVMRGAVDEKELDGSKGESVTLAQVGLVRELGVKRCPMMLVHLGVVRGRRLYAPRPRTTCGNV